MFLNLRYGILTTAAQVIKSATIYILYTTSMVWKLNKYSVWEGEGTVLLGVSNELVVFCVKIPLVYQEFCILCRCGSTVVKTSIHT